LSFLGKNIRKIRIAKKLSQTDFALLFDLKRTALGAYEEGRAEPKISTVIKISEYFKISTDILIKNEITVNQIFGFNEKLLNLKNEIPFISVSNLERFAEQGFSPENFEKIIIPSKFKRMKIAFELPEDIENYKKGDIIICSEFKKNSNKKKLFIHNGKIQISEYPEKSTDVFIPEFVITADLQAYGVS